MLQKDFLMRRIQELMRIVALALRFRQDGKIIPSLEAIAQAYDELPDFEKSQIKQFSPTELKAHLLLKEYEVEYIEVIAQLLFQEGETLLLDGQNEAAKDRFSKAGPLLSYVSEEKKEFSLERMNQQARIRVVVDSL